MKVLVLQDELYEYLQHVVRKYAASGIDPEEGQALYLLHNAVRSAKTVDEAKVTTGHVGNTPVAVVEPSGGPPEF